MGAARTFKDLTSKYWPYWPLPHYLNLPITGLHADGLHLRRKAVVLISSNELGQPVGWYLARSERSDAWRALMDQSRKPLMIVTDGAGASAKPYAANGETFGFNGAYLPALHLPRPFFGASLETWGAPLNESPA